MSQERKQRILDALTVELQRQGPPGPLDLDALAGAVDAALGPDALAPLPINEGRHPDELNSANDD